MFKSDLNLSRSTTYTQRPHDLGPKGSSSSPLIYHKCLTCQNSQLYIYLYFILEHVIIYILWKFNLCFKISSFTKYQWVLTWHLDFDLARRGPLSFFMFAEGWNLWKWTTKMPKSHKPTTPFAIWIIYYFVSFYFFFGGPGWIPALYPLIVILIYCIF